MLPIAARTFQGRPGRVAAASRGELLVADCAECGEGPIMLVGPPVLPDMLCEAGPRAAATAYLRRLGRSIEEPTKREDVIFALTWSSTAEDPHPG
ncbi:hypothetical protein [Actinomadura fibrosa]|uniref:Uncharacterized protein n=1 Tax=Actinomadura fibrosa TaxID=111802 RepID=A0ABW2Y2N8_9ACTN|nr:hypothetical protein [Actinomadura fibrosa]